MRVYEAIIKSLESVGVGAAFGGPGESNTGIMLALRDSQGVRPVITRNEQAASFMACGYAMFTDRLGVCFATAGPGAFNLVSGLSMALTDSYPVLAITGYSSLAMTGKGALNETSGLGRTPDSQKVFEAVTKRSYLLQDISQTCALLEEAVNLAFEGRPGPVHIAVAEDLTDPNLEVPAYYNIERHLTPVTPDPAAIEAAAGTLVQALRDEKNVVVLAGFGAVRSHAGPVLRAFAERFQVPVLTTLDGKGIIPEAHPLAAGVFADTGHESAHDLLIDADVVVAVGNSFSQHATFDFRPDLFDGKQLIHINIDPGEIGKVYRADHGIVSDAYLAINALHNAMSAAAGPGSVRSFQTRRRENDPVLSLGKTLHPAEMTQSLSRMLPDDAVVLGDAGAHTVWLGHYLELREGQNFRKPGTFGPMAGHTNGAMGIKAAQPERTVVVGCGDGSYLMSGFELMTAVEYDLPVIWIIFNDGEFKLIKIYQVGTYLDHALTEFRNPDYVAYAKACGAEAYRVESLNDFERAFKAALASGKPTLIDASISRLVLPPYTPSPHGFLAGAIELARQRLAAPSRPGFVGRLWRRVRRVFGGG
jgi:acetolactate synthase I/II/III large subunit